MKNRRAGDEERSWRANIVINHRQLHSVCDLLMVSLYACCAVGGFQWTQTRSWSPGKNLKTHLHFTEIKFLHTLCALALLSTECPLLFQHRHRHHHCLPCWAATTVENKKIWQHRRISFWHSNNDYIDLIWSSMSLEIRKKIAHKISSDFSNDFITKFCISGTRSFSHA